MDKFVTRKRKVEELDPVETSTKAKIQTFKKIQSDNLDCDYGFIYTGKEAQDYLAKCEQEMTYFTGQLSKVFVFGKWHDIPRKQVSRKRDTFVIPIFTATLH